MSCGLEICLNCPKTNLVKITRKGWWKPNCAHWNPYSSNGKELYGCKPSCAFYFEQTVEERNLFCLFSEKGMEFLESIDFSKYDYMAENKGLTLSSKNSKVLYLNSNLDSFTPFGFENFFNENYLNRINKRCRFKNNKMQIEVLKMNSWLERKLRGEFKKETKEIKFNVAGVTFDGRQEILKDLLSRYDENNPYEVVFEKEIGNKFDDNAVKVFVENKNIGYIPKKNKFYEEVEVFNKFISDNLEKTTAKVSFMGVFDGVIGVQVKISLNLT